MSAAKSVSDDVRNHLLMLLNRSGLPKALVDRLLEDVDGGEHFRRVASIQHVRAVDPNSSYWGASYACCCSQGVMVPNGTLGKLKDENDFVFLKPGYHRFSAFGQEYLGEVTTNDPDRAVIHGSAGFVTITEGHIGTLLVGSTFRLLAPGVYEWNSPAVRFLQSVDVTGKVANLGPFTLVTIDDGTVAVTYHNGDLRILGANDRAPSSEVPDVASSPPMMRSEESDDVRPTKRIVAGSVVETRQQRTFFLDDPKWIYSTSLSLKEQTDKLEGNDLLSRDNVEILMVAMSQWRICDAYRAINNCAEDMEKIRVKVNQLVRATIARIVAGTNIGAGGGGTGATVNHGENHDEQNDLAHLMLSDTARSHMKELSTNLSRLGVQVHGVYIPERYFKNNDLRQEIARQAVIGIKAEAERSAADAASYAMVAKARAEAEAIAELAKAHSDAGKLLGAPTETAARMALSEITAKSLSGANITIFSGAPDQMPFMFTAPPAGTRALQ